MTCLLVDDESFFVLSKIRIGLLPFLLYTLFLPSISTHPTLPQTKSNPSTNMLKARDCQEALRARDPLKILLSRH